MGGPPPKEIRQATSALDAINPLRPITAVVDTVKGVASSIEKGLVGGEHPPDTGDLSPEGRARIAAQRQLDLKAKSLGFADEADRINKINTIINSFSKKSRSMRGVGGAPVVLQGK